MPSQVQTECDGWVAPGTSERQRTTLQRSKNLLASMDALFSTHVRQSNLIDFAEKI
jgi:hypothetical protein